MFAIIVAGSAISPASSQGPRRFLHFLPFLASVGIALVLGLGRPGPDRPAMTAAGPTDGAIPDPGSMILSILMVISFLPYTLKLVAMSRTHAKGIPDYFSHDSIAVNLTIEDLALALDSGFNSKSSFNEAFKGIMRCTPSEYRKSVRP